MKNRLMVGMLAIFYFGSGGIQSKETGCQSGVTRIWQLPPGVHPSDLTLSSSISICVVSTLSESLNLYLVSNAIPGNPADDTRLQAEAMGITETPDYPLESRLTSSSIATLLPGSEVLPWPFIEREDFYHVDASKAWKITTGGSDATGTPVVIAIIDGGMDLYHGDLKDQWWHFEDHPPGINFIHPGKDPVPNYHGTLVAGILGADGLNQEFTKGVNWKVSLLPVITRVDQVSGFFKALQYVYQQKNLWLTTGGTLGAPIAVLNITFGIPTPVFCHDAKFTVWDEFFDLLGSVGITTVAASPNGKIDVDEQGDVPSTCSSQSLIVVGRVNEKRQLTGSIGEKSIDIYAPGDGLLTLYPRNQMGRGSGTSLATPFVAGTIALMRAAYPASFYQQTYVDQIQLERSLLLNHTSQLSETGLTLLDMGASVTQANALQLP